MDEGHPRYPLDAGSLALDFLNTRTPTDVLTTPSGLVGWLEAAGLLPDPSWREALRSPPSLRLLSAEAQRLRGHLAEALSSFCDGESIPSFARFGLNRVLAAGCRTFHLGVGSDGAFSLEATDRVETPLALLCPIARAAAELVTTVDPSRVRRCAGDECLAWFVDTSKGGRRKWCSMERCGNRAKAARHRRRRDAAEA